MKSAPIILLSALILSGCSRTDTRPDCSAVYCMANLNSIKLKYVDKTTNKPLFAQGSVYTPDDLNVTRTAASNYPPVITEDSTDQTILVLNPVLGNEILTLGDLPADKITMTTRTRGKECCAPVDIISLKINGETICAPCNDLNNTIAVIRK